jgi:hypothetical protein
MRFVVTVKYETGDRVRWERDTPTMDDQWLAAGTGIVDSLDPNDDLWDVDVQVTGTGGEQHWMKSTDLLPEPALLPKPPTFSSIEDAEAWMEANS